MSRMIAYEYISAVADWNLCYGKRQEADTNVDTACCIFQEAEFTNIRDSEEHTSIQHGFKCELPALIAAVKN